MPGEASTDLTAGMRRPGYLADGSPDSILGNRLADFPFSLGSSDAATIALTLSIDLVISGSSALTPHPG
ncbi:hypothetical protein MES4922_190287 [Mesorhizobium ventifaucium]|uniref:Uncharacterized protein n=1 Tax=Mesorhizobium ventifaucium TaxID=666020 RepID=A0ABN8JJT5_9HYPH|nr:hypothetical protein MES4922_190287 [Mesorhizobium ventifaucium]